MGLGLWIVTAIVGLAAVILFVLAHFIGGVYTEGYTFGAVLVALVITLGVLNATKNPGIIIGVFAFLSLFLIAAETYDWFGLRGVL